MYGWNDRPNKAKPVSYIGDGEGGHSAAIYEIGEWQITIDKDGGVTYRSRYRHSSDPRSTLPNMSISDGEVRIPVSDLAAEMLKRLDPADLATSLIEVDEVREALLDRLANRWSSGVSEQDRRKFLRDIQAEVHDEVVSRLADTMAELEYGMSKRSFFYHDVNRVNELLRENGYKDRDGNPIRLRHEDDDPDFKIGGRHWNEARNWWRAEVSKRFPGPAEAGSAAEDSL